jgi:hypothetical protein
MALDDFATSEVGIAVAATAVALSPGVRRTLRRGVVVGLAAIMKAGDTMAGAARGAANEIQQTASAGAAAAQDTVTEARATSRRSRNSRGSNEK